MKAKSLSVFRTKLRIDDEGTVLVTIGQVIEGDEEHLRNLARNRLVEIIEDGAEASAKPAKAKVGIKAKSTAKPAKGKKVEGEIVSEPLAGTGEAVQMPAPEGTETLPPVQHAPEGGEGSE